MKILLDLWMTFFFSFIEYILTFSPDKGEWNNKRKNITNSEMLLKKVHEEKGCLTSPLKAICWLKVFDVRKFSKIFPDFSLDDVLVNGCISLFQNGVIQNFNFLLWFGLSSLVFFNVWRKSRNLNWIVS